MFGQVCLCLDEICLEQCQGIFLLQLDAPGLAVFLKLTCFCDEAISDAHNLYFRDRISCRSCIVNTLVEPLKEALERLSGVKGSHSLVSFAARSVANIIA